MAEAINKIRLVSRVIVEIELVRKAVNEIKLIGSGKSSNKIKA